MANQLRTSGVFNLGSLGGGTGAPTRKWGGMQGRGVVVGGAATYGDFAKIGSKDSAFTAVTDYHLRMTGDSGAGWRSAQLDVFPTSGKFYVEFYGVGGLAQVGIAIDGQIGLLGGTASEGFGWLASNGETYGTNAGSWLSGGYASTDIVGIAIDVDNSTFWSHVNGTWVSTGGDPATGSGRTFAVTDAAYSAAVAAKGTGTFDIHINTGDNGTFGGNVTAGGNTDDNGRGDFKYTVPTGFTGLYSSTAASDATLANTGVLKLSELLQATYPAPGIPVGVTASEYLVLAGGGGGGADSGGSGGGGAGGVLTSSSAGALTGTYTITVGAGGAAASGWNSKGSNGGDSSISGSGLSVTATGGGAGGTRSNTLSVYRGSSGGSGGGTWKNETNGGAGVAGPPRQGYDGGAGTGSFSGFSPGGAGPSGGGGGGAGEAGDTDGTGYGGDGITNSLLNAIGHGDLSGSNRYVAGGGGGAWRIGYNNFGGPGGLGGGGHGDYDDRGVETNGTNGFGGGGGGGYGGANKGKGGSGVVIIKTDAQATGTTGTVTETEISGAYYYKFTGNGTVTFP